MGKWDIHTYPVKLIKRVRIVKRADGFYVQFCVETEVNQEPRIADGEIGLDVGLEYFYSDSNGHHEPNPRFLRKSDKSIKHAQRRIYTHLYTFAQNDQKDKLHLQPEFRQYCRVFSLLWRKCRHFLSQL